MKVYCKNCSYLYHAHFKYMEYDICKFCAIGEKGNIRPAMTYEINKKGNCKTYKRKWWKFWVKALSSRKVDNIVRD